MRNKSTLLIELPTWIGDSVMATPTIEALIHHLKPSSITLVGSYASIALFERDTRFNRRIVDTTKKTKRRIKNTLKLAHELGKHDVAFSFRGTFFSHLLLWQTKSTMRVAKYSSLFSHLFLTHTLHVSPHQHYVKQYFSLFTHFFDATKKPTPLQLYTQDLSYQSKTVAIVPGAIYGSAKRWYPKEYAKVAIELSKEYHILLLGGATEVDIGLEIRSILEENGITNVTNLVAKTSINELVDTIKSVDLFIGGDSGPMHIAAACQTPTVAIYGPTDHRYSHPWMNHKHLVVRKELSCSPCAKRTCPIKTHECMTTLYAKDVLNAVQVVLSR